METYLKFINRINDIIRYIVSISFVILSVLVVLQVITRFIINYPLSWSEEISRYLMIYIVFFGSALAMRKQEHIAIDFLLEIVSAKVKRKLNIIILWICAVFFASLAYYGSNLTLIVVGQVTPTLQFSMAWAYAAIPIGSILILLNVFALLIELRINGTNRMEGEA